MQMVPDWIQEGSEKDVFLFVARMSEAMYYLKKLLHKDQMNEELWWKIKREPPIGNSFMTLYVTLMVFKAILKRQNATRKILIPLEANKVYF